ncbi:RNA-directed DNA polymerase, eukaryota [Tanacetum coccineum]
MAKRYHPDANCDMDKNENDGCDFIDIHNAYVTLSDPTTRALYNLKISNGLERRSGRLCASMGPSSGICTGQQWETGQCWQILDDRWFWDLNGDGVFQVKDVRSMLDEAFLPKMEVPTRWIKSIPIKVNVFAWDLYLDRLPTRSNLSRRNVSLSSLACPLCDHVLEDSSHLFFGCSVAKDIQKLICRWWNLDVHPYESYEDWLSWFKSIRLGSKTKECSELMEINIAYLLFMAMELLTCGKKKSNDPPPVHLPGDVKLLLVAFDSQLKIFYPLLNDYASGEHP